MSYMVVNLNILQLIAEAILGLYMYVLLEHLKQVFQLQQVPLAFLDNFKISCPRLGNKDVTGKEGIPNVKTCLRSLVGNIVIINSQIHLKQTYKMFLF